MFQSAVIQDEYEFTGHNSALGAVCYNRHQDTFVSVDETCLRLWRASGGQIRHVSLPARTSRFIQAITYVDARQIFVASALDGALRLYDPNLNELAALFTGRGTVLCMVFDAKHNRVLTGGVDGCMAWQIKTRPSGMPVGGFNPQYEFTQLPKFFRSTNSINISAKKGKQFGKDIKSTESLTERSGWVENLQLLADSNRLYAQTRHCIDIFNTADGTHLERCEDLFPSEHGTLTAFVVQERAKNLVCGTSSGVIIAYSRHPFTIVHLFKDHTQAITSLAEHTTSRLIISSSLDGSVRLWDLEARRQAHRLNVGRAVHGLQLLPPASPLPTIGSTPRTNEVEMPGRFCCQLRNSVKIYDIHSILKEHQPCHVPVSVLQRVLFPIKSLHTPRPQIDTARTTRSRKLRSDEDGNEENEDESTDSDGERNSDFDSDSSDDPGARKTQQLVLVACMDKTLRVFAGRTANEAPSFTWIPDEQALDLVAFALHPVSHHLFLLLSSQKLLIINAAPRHRSRISNDEGYTDEVDDDAAEIEDAEATANSIERIINLNPPSTAQRLPITTSEEWASDNVEAGYDNLNEDSTSFPKVEVSSNSAGSAWLRSGSGGGESLQCICVCPFRPVFHAALSSDEVDKDPQASRASRSFAGRSSTFGATSAARRRQMQYSSVNLPEPSISESSHRRNALVRSEWEWIACGSNTGELLFWHTGLRDGREAALSLDAHDTSIVDISASTSSPLLVSLDTAGRVHVWSLQPTFALRHVLELGQSPSVFALSPLSEIILSGYDDGRVVLHAVGYQAAYVETFAGGDDQHFTTVSAGDFLDERSLVLTVSVDAVVKVWDQNRILLRQVALATAVSSLCFLNADGDLLAGLTTGTFVISRRDVLPDKMPAPALRRRVRVNPLDTGSKQVSHHQIAIDADVATMTKVATSEKPIVTNDAGNSECPVLPPLKNDLVASRPGLRPESAARRLVAHVIQRPVEAANHLQPPVLRAPNSTSRYPSRGNNSSFEHQTKRVGSASQSATSYHSTEQQDWRDKILPLSAHQKLMRASQRGLSYRRKKSQIPSLPLVLQSLGPSSRSSNAKARRHNDSTSDRRDDHQLSIESPCESPAVSLGLGSMDSPVNYCKHQAPVPPKDKTPRKLWNAIGGEDRRLIVLQRNHLPPC